MRKLFARQLQGHTVDVGEVMKQAPWRDGHNWRAGGGGNTRDDRANDGGNTDEGVDEGGGERPSKKPRYDDLPTSRTAASTTGKVLDDVIIRQPTPILPSTSFTLLDASFVAGLPELHQPGDW